ARRRPGRSGASPRPAPRDGSRARGAAQEPRRQEQDRLQQVQHAADRNSQNPERQEQQPHERVEDEREQRERPAEHQQDQPEQEADHRSPSCKDLRRPASNRSDHSTPRNRKTASRKAAGSSMGAKWPLFSNTRNCAPLMPSAIS